MPSSRTGWVFTVEVGVLVAGFRIVWKSSIPTRKQKTINQSINQTINQSINQSINQTNKRRYKLIFPDVK